MNFKFLICNNCENEELDNSFLIFGPKNAPIVNKNKNSDFNIKSILSSLDNNPSTNNLEIIEYPYSYNSNNEFPLEPLPLPPEPIIENKKKYNELDDFLEKIRPPKLFNEESKENKENKENKDIKENKDNKEIKKIKEIKENNENKENEKQKLNIKIMEIKKLEKKEDKDNYKDNSNFKEIFEIKEEEKNNDKNNNIDKKHSKQTSSLINNEDSFLNNKALLNNYYSNCNSARNKHEHNNKKNFFNKKIENNIKIKINSNNEKEIDNKENSHSKFYTSITNEIKINCPKPDTDIIIKKTKDKNIFIKKSNLKNKETKLKINDNKKEENKNNSINNKLKKYNTNFTSRNYKNIMIKSQKVINNNYNITKRIKKDKKNIIENNKYHIKIKSKNKLQKKNLEHIKEINLSNTNIGGRNDPNENIVLKTEPNNQSKLNNLSKNSRSKYLSNSYLNDLIKIKINLKKRNTFTNPNNIYKKRNFKANNFEFIYPLIKSANFSSKIYSNPFVKASDKNKSNKIN